MTSTTTTRPLAVCVPVVGVPSETFVRRHVELLQPGGTVVIARRAAAAGSAGWAVDAPTLWLDELSDEWGGAREQAAVASFLAEHGVRSVLMEYLDIWLPFLPVLRRAGVRGIAHAHGYDVSMRLREDYWRSAYLAYRDVDAIVTMSQHSRRRLVALGLPAELVHVVPYGVDVPALRDRASAGMVQVLLIGRLVAKKNPVATLAACARAADMGANVHVTVVGDGPLMAGVQSFVAGAGLPVTMLGAQPHATVLEALATADIFCQHSVVDPQTGDEEGVPVAILEAMAHALPVVSTRHAGIPEAVVDGVTGYLVDEGDVEAMAGRIAELAADPQARHRLGAAGRAKATDEFSWARERDALLEVLHLDGARMRA
jgi:colanic acid/amylovoran biosynthesis glycosyltransferase